MATFLNRKILKAYFNTLPRVLRVLMLGGLLLLLSFLFPNNVQLDFSIEQGTVWKYDDLRAPFAFPIKKFDAEIEKERSAIENEFIPYYRLDRTVIDEQLKKFKLRFNEKYQSYKSSTNNIPPIDSAYYADLGTFFLKKVYNKHIVDLPPLHQNKAKKFSFLLLEKNVELGEYKLSNYYTTKEATQLLVDTLEKLAGKITEPNLLLSTLAELIQEPDISFDKELTQKNLEAKLASISTSQGMVKSGEIIIRRNEIVDSLAYAKLISFGEKYQLEVNKNKSGLLVYIGYLSISIALLAILALFVRVFERDVYNNLVHFSLILLLILGFSYLSVLIAEFPHSSYYIIPFCIVPVILQSFFSDQLAIFTHIVVVLLVCMFLSLDYQFCLVETIVGVVIVLSKRKSRYLTDFFLSLLFISLAYAACFISIELIHKGTIFSVLAADGSIIEEGIEWRTFSWIMLNVSLTLLSYPFIPLIEKGFGLTSDISLVELSDLNKPLLKELSLRASGTMQHSLQVANLAETAAAEIGANALLVKVGALYHDIGKMLDPECFIENQNQKNPHKELTNVESAKRILAHVTEGAKLAKKYGLPNVIIDFIRTHHGTTRVEYFYRLHQEEVGEEHVDENAFRYPGPKPRTKEEVVLMLADSLEAAAKSLKSPSNEDIENLVDSIIRYKISLGQFTDSNLTFNELETIRGVFKRLLRSIYHLRIEYPE